MIAVNNTDLNISLDQDLVNFREFMGHPQLISLYRQEVNINFLLQFFHRQ